MKNTKSKDRPTLKRKYGCFYCRKTIGVVPRTCSKCGARLKKAIVGNMHITTLAGLAADNGKQIRFTATPIKSQNG